MRETITSALGGADVSRETMEKLEAYVSLLLDESARQNLIAKSTIDDVWHRHVADSAQLVALGGEGKSWADIGSGAGLPGLVIAILTRDPVLLIEPRRLRAEFLDRAAQALGLDKVTVAASKVEGVRGQFDVVTARAVAPAVDLLGISSHLAHRSTRFLLMKGRSAKTELEAVRRAWQGDFRLVPSRTDEEASILVADNVRRKGVGTRK